MEKERNNNFNILLKSCCHFLSFNSFIKWLFNGHALFTLSRKNGHSGEVVLEQAVRFHSLYFDKIDQEILLAFLW